MQLRITSPLEAQRIFCYHWFGIVSMRQLLFLNPCIPQISCITTEETSKV